VILARPIAPGATVAAVVISPCPISLGERALDEVGGIELFEQFHDYSNIPAFTVDARWLGVHRPASRKIRGPSASLGMTQKSDDASKPLIFVSF